MSRDEASRNKTAARLTPAHIDATILTEQYYVPDGTALTICVLTLQNGFHVVGHSAPVSPENFDEAIGRKVSREKAREQIWALEGYALRNKLNDAEVPVVPPR